MGKIKSKGAVSWVLPNKKKPIGYSTVAESELVVEISKEVETINDLYNELIKTPLGYRMAEIIKKFIEAGYGENKASDIFW